jgi:MFS family permease
MLKGDPDYGLRLGRLILRIFTRQKSRSQEYASLSQYDDPDSPTYDSLELQERHPSAPKKKPKRRRTLPFHRIFTRNVVIVLLSRGLLAMHVGTFQNLWYIFLSTSRAHNRGTDDRVDMFHFTGGLGLPPATLGLAMSILGGVGIAIQLFLYPTLSHKFGTVSCFRFSLLLFPIVYFIAPFLAILPSTTKPPLPAAGVVVWTGILTFLGLHVAARMFAMPSATILVNNCCPHPSVLSTVHGVSQSVASGMRMLGPILGGWGFGLGLKAGIVGAAFWVLMGFSSLGALFGMLAQEGSGHDIVLEGDEDLLEEVEKPKVVRKERRGS